MVLRSEKQREDSHMDNDRNRYTLKLGKGQSLDRWRVK